MTYGTAWLVVYLEVIFIKVTFYIFALLEF